MVKAGVFEAFLDELSKIAQDPVFAPLGVPATPPMNMPMRNRIQVGPTRLPVPSISAPPQVAALTLGGMTQ